MYDESRRFVHSDSATTIEHYETLRAKSLEKLITIRMKSSKSYFKGHFKIRHKRSKILDKLANLRPMIGK